MENSSENDEQLISFLRSLADSIELKKLEPTQLQRIGEFFMSYKLSESSTNESNTEDDDFDSMDVVKFITMGWYIYRILLDKNKETEDEEVNT